jgi:Carboxypeptidase regulatory-like domain
MNRLTARGESPASHRGRRCALLHPTAHSPRRGGPGRTARRAQSGVPCTTVRVVHGGVQYREYLNEEQRSQPRGPQRGSRVGVEEGCSAGRMQLDFHHGLLRCAVAAALLLIAWPGEAGSVIGRVVDAAGRPPASVRIEIVPYTDADSPGAHGDRTASKNLAGTAAADGSFRIQLPADWPPSEIHVSSAGSVTLRAADVVTGADDFDLGLLTLPPAQMLQGVVRDESGQAISGAHVRALAVDGRADLLPGASISDHAGRYLILDAPQRVAQMIVTHARYVSQSAPRTRSTWILKQGGTIQGVIVDDHGRPVSNAQASAADRTARSAALGTFSLDALSPGLTRVIAWDDQGRVAIADVLVVDRETVSATLSLQPGVVVRGAIRDASTGRPVPWARVRAYQGSPSSTAVQREMATVADASGIFRVVGLEPAQYTFEARRSSYLRAVQSHTVTRTARSLEMALLLTPEARIEGRVTDTLDRPIAGARVSVTESNPMQELARQLRAGRRDTASTYSGADGRFVLRGLWPGRALRVEASASKFVPARLDGIELAAGTVRSGLTLSLHAGATATGTVTDQQDRPLANVQVFSTRIDESGSMPGAARLLQPSDSTASTITMDDGRYVLGGLEQGRYFQTFVRQGYSRGFMPATHILAGTVNELPPVTLGVAAAIRGRVVDQQRGPIAGANVYAIDRTLDVLSTVTDSNGHFELTNLTEGDEVSLQVESDHAAPGQVKVRAPASNVTIQLSEALMVRGRVYDASTSQPITDFSVERIVRAPGTITFRLGGSAARMFHADDGLFELNGLPPGPCVLRVRASGYQAAEVAVPSVPVIEEIAVPVLRGTSVAGRVLLTGSRQPVPNATITWRQGDAARAELETMFSSLATSDDTAVTDADGRFVLEGVPTGAVTLFATHAEYAPIRTNITVPARPDIELTMSSGGVLAGVVMLDQGGPAAGATVALTPAGERVAMAPPDTATADGSGRFRFGHLREGSYTLVARVPTGASPPFAVAIAGAEQHDDLVLTLRSGTTIRGSVRDLRRDDQSNVFVMAHGEGYYDSTYTDASGAFLLPHVPAGTLALEATTFRRGLTAGTRLDVPENGPATIDVDIDFGGQSELAGIVSRAGIPLPSVSINATPLLPSVTTRGRAESAADGRYRMEGLSDGRYQIVLSGPFGLYRRIADVKGPTQLDVDLPSGSITGTVTDATSQEPVAEAVITAISGRERAATDAKQTVTDSRGAYTLADLDAGTYQVRATRSGYQQEARVITMQQSEQRADFELQPHDGFRLRVIDATNGAPVSHANVRVTAQGVLVFADTVTLDNGGRADVPSLAPGAYLLTVLVAGYAPRSLPIQVPTAAIDVAVEPGGRVELRLPTITSTRVRLVDAAGIAQAVPGSDPAGWAAIAGPTTAWTNVAAGPYRLESMTGGVTAITVKNGTTLVVDVK